MMAFSRNWLSNLILATILAIGTLILWIGGAMWIDSIIRQLFLTEQNYTKNLIVTTEGQPLLQIHNPAKLVDPWETETLDGHPVAMNSYDDQWNKPLNTSNAVERVREISRWSGRIFSFGISQPTPTLWYLICEGDTPGYAYYVGYDYITNAQIGYMSKAGFSLDRPPAEQHFQFLHFQSNRRGYYGPSFAGLLPSAGHRPHNLADRESVTMLMAMGELWRIDFRHRTVKQVSVPGEVIDIGNCEAPHEFDTRRKTMDFQVAVRLPEELLLMDLDGTVLRTVPLPADFRNVAVAPYRTLGPELLLVANQHYWSDKEPLRIDWIGADGAVTRHAQLPPPPAKDRSYRRDSWGMSAIFPAPLLMQFAITVPLPRQMIDQGEAPDYPAALAKSASEAWPPMLVLFIASGLMAWYAYRWQRRYSATGAAAWAAFVFLLGLPGLAGYLLHRHWPARARCESCGVEVPRDRLSCLVCSLDFSPPVRTDYEIHA